MALSGPTLPSLHGPATHLVVLVHGYGADGNDLIGLAEHWRQALPGAAFAAPNAPARAPGSGGYQWFAITRLDPHEMANGVAQAGPVLEDFLAAELARLNLGPDRLALVGFSQGTMLSLAVGLKLKPAAIVGFSGLLAGPVPDQAAAPPIFLCHGDADQTIPASAMLDAAVRLGAAGRAVQWHLAPGVGHGIDPVGLALAGDFLAQAFDGKLAARGAVCCPLK